LVSGRPSAAAAVLPFFLSPSFSLPLRDLFGVTFSLLLVGLTFSSLESTYFGFSAEVVLALFGVKNVLIDRWLMLNQLTLVSLLKSF